MLGLKSPSLRKEFIAERFYDGLQFRKKFSVILITFFTLIVLGDLLFFFYNIMPGKMLAIRYAVITVFLLLYFLLGKIECFSKLVAKATTLVYDTIIFALFSLAIAGLMICVFKSVRTVYDDSQLYIHLEGGNIWLPFLFCFYFFHLFVIHWIYKVLYLSGFVLSLVVYQAQIEVQVPSIFIKIQCLIMIIMIVLIDEWSHRVNFVKKKAFRERIGLFETVLKRIQEYILVFNLRLDLKYSNVDELAAQMRTTTTTTDFTITEDQNFTQTCITSLKNIEIVSEGKFYQEFLDVEPGNLEGQVMTLESFLGKIAASSTLYDKVVEQKFVTVKGKIPKNQDMFNANHTDLFFTIQIVTKSWDQERCLVAIIKDITEHLAAFQKKIKTQSNLLLNSLSHELNTPLAIAQTLIENAVFFEKPHSQLRHTYLEPALTQIQILRHFINDVLDFIKIQKNEFSLNLSTICMESLLLSVKDLIQISLEKKKLQLILDFDTSKRTIIKTDPQRLRQVLLNLLINATKYTTKGAITISFSEVVENHKYVIKISDTGIGLNEHELSILRTKLEKNNFALSVNKNSTGAGIGLIISNLIAQALNCSLTEGLKIESQAGKGTVLSLEIENQGNRDRLDNVTSPTDSEPNVSLDDNIEHLHTETRIMSSLENLNKFRTSENIIYSSNLLSNRLDSFRFIGDTARGEHLQTPKTTCLCKRILVVDDEVFNTIAAEMICKSIGYSVDSAFNGQDALDAISKRASEQCGPVCKWYDLIIMDCNMPIMDGYAATKKIREKIKEGEWRNLTIVGCTAYEGREKLDQCLESGMDTYVKKPLDKAKLQVLLNKFKT